MDPELASAPYRNVALATEERVADLMARMTLDEKIAQLGGVFPRFFVGEDNAFDTSLAPRALGNGIGHISYPSGVTALGPRELATLLNDTQRYLVEQTRLGIPAVAHGESAGGYTGQGGTVFPQAIGLASTWHPELIGEMTTAIRRQMRAVGIRHTLSPVLDIVRDGRWGRCEETYGEDPYLAGQIGIGYVRGMQGSDLRDGVVCTGKHFLGYGASEGGMNWAPAHIPARELREIYAAPFEAVIRGAGLASVMNSYAEIDGVPLGASKEWLRDYLRDELGFTGTVISDYFTVQTLDTYHHIAGDRAEAAARALEAGMDLEVPTLHYYRSLPDALASNRISMALIDEAVARVLHQKVALGVFEQPYVDADAAPLQLDTPADHALARRIAAESIVLLKNDGDLLPLDQNTRSIAVIGPAADSIRLLQGDYHFPAHVEVMFGAINENGDEQGPSVMPSVATDAPSVAGPRVDLRTLFTPHTTVLEGIRKAAGGEILHARGCGISSDDTSGIADAVKTAQAAEVAIVCVGTRSGLVEGATSGESSDRTDLALTAAQRQLVEAVVATDTPTVVVLINGGIVAIPWIAEHVPAVIEAWLPGEEAGHALADVIFGDVNPSGRLPVSLPRTTGQVPIYYNHKPSGGRSNWRGNYVDSPSTPLYAFGHGLSYTTFEYRELVLSANEVPASGAVTISVDVTNTGSRAGDEVVQLYAHDVIASTTRPVKQLVGFTRVALAADEKRTVTFALDMSQLALYDPQMRLVVEPGTVEVMVGASSGDIRARASFEIVGNVRELRRREIVRTEVRIS